MPSRVADYSATVERALPPALRGDRTAVGLSEAIANAILHGALALCSNLRDTGDIEAFLDQVIAAEEELGPSRFIEIEIRAEEDGAEVVVRDPGGGFDWRRAPSGDGRGLAIMAKVFHRLAWNDAGNEVHLALAPRAHSSSHPSEQGAP